MRGGCTDRNSRRRPLVESLESQSDDPCEPGPLDCCAKKLEFGSEKEHIVNIIGRTDDERRHSIGDGARIDDAGNAGEEGTQVRRST